MQQHARIVVRGRVQGVNFRANTRRMAATLGVSGYVRNLADGAVEIVAEGEAKAIAELVKWARKGPSAARVDDVSVDLSEPTGNLGGFTIRYG